MNRVVYIAHKDGDELAHYGVKGQKWGVRREITDDGYIDRQMKKRKSN